MSTFRSTWAVPSSAIFCKYCNLIANPLFSMFFSRFVLTVLRDPMFMATMSKFLGDLNCLTTLAKLLKLSIVFLPYRTPCCQMDMLQLCPSSVCLLTWIRQRQVSCLLSDCSIESFNPICVRINIFHNDFWFTFIKTYGFCQFYTCSIFLRWKIVYVIYTVCTSYNVRMCDGMSSVLITAFRWCTHHVSWYNLKSRFLYLIL